MGDCCVPSRVLAAVLPNTSPSGEMLEDLTRRSGPATLSLTGFPVPPVRTLFASAFKSEGIAVWDTSGFIPVSLKAFLLLLAGCTALVRFKTSGLGC